MSKFRSQPSGPAPSPVPPTQPSLKEVAATLRERFPHADPELLAEGLKQSLSYLPASTRAAKFPVSLHVEVPPDTVRWLVALVEACR